MRAVPTLKKNKEFRALAYQGKKWVTQSVILQGARPSSQNTGHIRVGYTVSRKVGCAVVRNKVKRRLRAVVQEIFSQKDWEVGDVVLIARPGSFDHPYADLLANVRWGLSHIERLLKEEPSS